MSDNVVLIVRFVPKPGKHEDFKASLVALIETMRNEEDFIDGVLHDDLERTGELVFYETWRGSKERWLRTQPPTSYRQTYEKAVVDLLDRREITWATPIGRWSGPVGT